MTYLRKMLCFLLAGLIPVLPVLGVGAEPNKAAVVRSWLTIGGSLLSFTIMAATGYALCPEGTPLSSRLLVALPVGTVAAITGGIAGRWIADTVLRREPSRLLSPFLGAGLGALGSAVVGGISFALAVAIAIPVVEADPGYWGPFNYPQAVGMGFLAGAFWGGLVGIPAGAIAVPIISVYLGF